MTNEKAKDALGAINSAMLDLSDINPYIETIKEAIEKQIPKKPIENIIVRPVIAENGAYVDADTDIYLLCPACGEQVGFNDSCNNYCRECGQKIGLDGGGDEMKSVLLSLSPYWYYLEGEGIKTIEVRKNKSKSSEWNRDVFCYMTKDMKSFNLIPKEYQDKYRPHMGKVGMKFVCDEIIEDVRGENTDILCEKGCLTLDELKAYGDNKTLYGWHISDLKIYDKPKELNEFTGIRRTKKSIELYRVERPPQSWMYVEELGGEQK